MGFSSYECPECDRSILALTTLDYYKLDNNLSKCTLIQKEQVIQGDYDGYLNIVDNFSEYEIDWGKPVKLYHTKCYERVNKPNYESAVKSKDSKDQGFFIDEERYKNWPNDIK